MALSVSLSSSSVPSSQSPRVSNDLSFSQHYAKLELATPRDKDVVAQVQSGFEKIAAFSIAVLQKIDANIESYQALILAPSRVLIQQIQEFIIAISGSMNITCHACFGGNRVRDDIKTLEDIRPQLVIGTPGRIQFMIQRGTLLTEGIKMFVLDETDKMSVVGFTESIYDIFPLLPQSMQVVVLSATMSRDVLELTTKFIRDPIRIIDQKEEVEDR